MSGASRLVELLDAERRNAVRQSDMAGQMLERARSGAAEYGEARAAAAQAHAQLATAHATLALGIATELAAVLQ